jgi:uncharacterized damage-inducible protein DinB
VRMNEMLLSEFDQEMANTRKTLERVPDDKLTWKPHDKSGTMGWLATHVATLPSWTVETMQKESLDIAPPGEVREPLKAAGSREEILNSFDDQKQKARAALAGASDEDLLEPWTLLATGKAMFTLPRFAVLRSFVMNHMIHHRAQLCVYLRMNDIPVPGLYGPSADEKS